MLNDIVIYMPQAPQFTFPVPAIVASGAVSTILAGTPTTGADATAASWTGAVIPMVDGDGTTSQRFTGIAKNTSSDTASAAGVVELWIPQADLIYAGKAKVASNANTLALISGLFGKRVKFDLTAGTWTVDTAQADASTNCVVIVGGDYQTSTIYFTVANQGNMFSAA